MAVRACPLRRARGSRWKIKGVCVRSRLFPLVALSLWAWSQWAAAGVQEDFRMWGNLTAITKLGSLNPDLSRWRWWLEGQGRFRESGGVPDQSIARTGLGYALGDHISVWLGHAYIAGFPDAGGTDDEHRLWQQLSWSASRPWGDLSSRSRLEQRFLEGVEEAGWRFRELVRFSRPVIEGGPLSYVAWDEVFIHLNTVGPSIQSGFDQNRGFAGFGYAFTKEARAELGYLNQFISTQALDRMNHILSLNLYLNF
jgi:hypothetical protein